MGEPCTTSTPVTEVRHVHSIAAVHTAYVLRAVPVHAAEMAVVAADSCLAGFDAVTYEGVWPTDG